MFSIMNKIDIRTAAIDDLSIRANDSDGQMKISGYALKFNVPSQELPEDGRVFTEYIKPSALDGVDLSGVLLLYGHEPNSILARVDSKTMSVEVDKAGLHFDAVLPDTTLGRDTYNNILAGNLKGCSFGFTIADDDWEFDDDRNLIHTINKIDDLREISITPIPAYLETSVEVARSLDKLSEKGDHKMAEKETEKPVEQPVEEKKRDNTDNNEEEKQNQPVIDYDKLAAAIVKAKGEAEPEPEEPKEKPDNSSEEPKQNEPSDDPDKDKQRDDDDPDDSDSDKENYEEDDAEPDKGDDDTEEREEKREMPKVLTDKKDEVTRSFKKYLMTGKTRDAVQGGVGLSDGQVIIPETILTPEKEQYQFPRLANLVRTVSVKTTTGKLPVFQTGDDVLAPHTEFNPTSAAKAPEIKPINWDLKTYTGKYVFSQELLQDSTYDWQAELQSRLRELEDNTNDQLIMGALTTGVNATKLTKADDVLDALKDVLNAKLKPMDSAAATIIMSQSAFAALDKIKDGEGRYMIQPDPTSATGKAMLGKTATVVEDTLFPKAKAGDVNIVVAPLQKAVINFKQSEITGQFIDTYDIWYRMLGIFLREDVVQARQDLINVLTLSASTASAVSSGK